MSAAALALALMLAAAPAAAPAAAKESAAASIFGRAEAAQQAGDRAGLETARVEIDALLASSPDSPEAHYTRGWILSRLERGTDAVAEYDRTLQLAPDFAAAAYNAGVVLMDLDREAEAVPRFDAAVAIEPDLTDAHYNLGQAYYNRHDFAKALAAWQRARELAPDDFQIAKKLVQAHHGLGDRDGAAKARLQAIEIWRNSSDPDVRKLKEFVFDQFEASGWHVQASEVLGSPEDAGYVYIFKVAGADGRVEGTVRLEPSYGVKDFTHIIGMSKGSLMWTPGPAFTSFPDYDTLKPVVLAAIAKGFSKP